MEYFGFPHGQHLDTLAPPPRSESRPSDSDLDKCDLESQLSFDDVKKMVTVITLDEKPIVVLQDSNKLDENLEKLVSQLVINLEKQLISNLHVIKNGRAVFIYGSNASSFSDKLLHTLSSKSVQYV